MQPIDFSAADGKLWKDKLGTYSSVSRLLRDLAEQYNLTRNDAGAILYDLFDGFSLDDISYIWKWDFAKSGQGLSDEALDQRLAHLLAK